MAHLNKLKVWEVEASRERLVIIDGRIWDFDKWVCLIGDF
jgi:hypothetical protein